MEHSIISYTSTTILSGDIRLFNLKSGCKVSVSKVSYAADKWEGVTTSKTTRWNTLISCEIHVDPYTSYVKNTVWKSRARARQLYFFQNVLQHCKLILNAGKSLVLAIFSTTERPMLRFKQKAGSDILFFLRSNKLREMSTIWFVISQVRKRQYLVWYL